MNIVSRRMATVLGALALASGLGGAARADFAPTFDIPSQYNFNLPGGIHDPNFDSENTYGYSFTVGAQPVVVDALAYTYAGAAGLVKIYVPGSATSVAEADIPGTAPTVTTANTTVYGYQAITPVTLEANTTYAIVWSYTGYGEAFNSNVDPADVIMKVPGITMGSGLSAYGYDQSPTGDDLSTGITFGPNLEVRAVPEPASLVTLSIAGALGLARLARRRLRRDA